MTTGAWLGDQGRSGGVASVIGREAELARLECFVSGASSGSAVLLIGGPGFGKTTLWEAAVGLARDQPARVLTARPSESASQLPFGGLIDLSDDLDSGELAGLPEPQRRALEVALMRAAPASEPAAPAVIAVGLLGVLRRLASRGLVLIAIDDLQSMDAASVGALTFVARRLDGTRVAFLLARRPGRPGGLEAVLSRTAVERVLVGSLSLGAVRRLLFERLGLAISHQRLRRIVEATGGNPLFALEVGRSLLDGEGSSLEHDVPVPDSLEEMLGNRVARLPAAVRRVLLALALSEDPRVDHLIGLAGSDALDDAVDAGTVQIDGGRVRASHPLLAAVAEKRSRARERREVHLALSVAAGDEPVRAMHLALATTGPDEGVASRVAAAAELARLRGARRQAALLATQGLRLTPADSAHRAQRVLELAGRLDDAGELRRMTTLLREEFESLPAGTPKARALLHLSESADVCSRRDQDRYLVRALAECGDDRNLRANVLVKLAGHAVAAGVSQLDLAEAWALEALDGAEDPMVRRYALWALAWPLGLTARPLDDLCARSSVADDPTGYISASPERVAAKQLCWRGEVAKARTALRALLTLAQERGDITSYAMVRMHAIEAEGRAGNFVAAERLLDEWSESSDFETQFRPQYPRCRAELEAGRGAAKEARRWASETIERAAVTGSVWDELHARHARGIAALIESAPDRALEDLSAVWEHCEREGVLDPGAFPVAPDLVETLVELERFDEAVAIASRLEEVAAQQDHPWARATAKRCAAVIELARNGYDEATAALLREASADFRELELRADHARCVLALGRAQRRFKQWRDARETLEEAIAAFVELGAEGWEQRTRSELERVGGRRRGGRDELTPSERRVVELAADGRSNKEIAAALYVTVNTVEVHLARCYRKLGVRSRAQLAKRLIAE